MRDLPRCRCWATSYCWKILARTRCDFPLNPWTANALSCRNHSQGILPCVDVTQGELGTGDGDGDGAGAEEPLPELMQKFCFIKFSSQAPNPNTYSYTLQCLTLTESAARGGVEEVWLGETNALKSFSFLTRQYFMTSAARGEEWRMVDWGEERTDLRLWLEQLGVATHWHIAGLCHWKIHSFAALLFTTKHNSHHQKKPLQATPPPW